MTLDATEPIEGEPPPATREMVRSEERSHISTEVTVHTRLRVAKRIVSEERTITVTIRREELVVEPVGSTSQDPGANLSATTPSPAAPSSRASGAAEAPDLELLLQHEVVEVVTRVVPYERVAVYIDEVTEEVAIDQSLRREVVDLAEDPSGGDWSSSQEPDRGH